jgi:dTDP-4-dehydrorhamnose reductase
MKIHIIGHLGMLGREACEILSLNHDVRGSDLPDLDISDPRSIDRGLTDWPEVVLNCAAYTDVDGCETHRDDAMRVNAQGPRHLADYAFRHNALPVHVSTDYVFSGDRAVPTPYREDDPTGPTSVYGQTKLAGELAIANSGCRYAIVRTSWLYGIHGANFLKTILKVALQKSEGALRVVNDQFGCPTWTRQLTHQLGAIIETGATGILHASGQGFCTWYDLARTFLSEMAIDRQTQPCNTDQFPRPAPRPKNSIMEHARLQSLGLDIMRDWRLDVSEFAKTYRDQLIEEV